jgi:hypothetical protein
MGISPEGGGGVGVASSHKISKSRTGRQNFRNRILQGSTESFCQYGFPGRRQMYSTRTGTGDKRNPIFFYPSNRPVHTIEGGPEIVGSRAYSR